MRITSPKNCVVFIMLFVLYLLFSIWIYITPLAVTTDQKKESLELGNGHLIYQKYNCQACHQLYGLGGYLGPDLTNVASQKGKSTQYIKAYIQAGSAKMPSFDMSSEELESIVRFLELVDKTGKAHPKNFLIKNDGRIYSK